MNRQLIKNNHFIAISKYESQLLKNVKFLKLLGSSISLFGIGGTIVGGYSLVFRKMSFDALPLIHTLILYSIGFIFVGHLFSQIAQLLARIKNFLKEKGEISED